MSMTNQTRNLAVRTAGNSSVIPVKTTSAIPLSAQIDMQTILGAFRRRWLIMIVTMTIVIGIGATYLFVVHKAVYESEAQLVVTTDKFQTATGRGDDFSMLIDLVNLAKRRTVMGQISVITSPDLLFDVAQKMGYNRLSLGYGTEINPQGMDLPDWALTVTSPKDSDLIIIKAKAYNGNVAAELANTVARTYLERDLGFSTTAAKQARIYVSAEIDKVQKRLSDAKLQLAQFKKKSKLITANSQIEVLSNNYQTMRYERDKAAIEAQAAKKQAEGIRRELVAQGNDIDESQTIQQNPQYQQALSRLSFSNAQRASLLQEYTYESPEVRRIDGEIAASKQELIKIAENVVGAKVSIRNPLLASYLQAQVNSVSASTRASSLANVVSQRSSELNKLPDAERSLSKILQQVNLLEQMYTMLSQKYYQLLINEKSTLQSSLFVATALPSRVPVYTRKQLSIVLILVAAFLAFCVAAIAEHMDNKVRDSGTVMKCVGELPLSVVPNQRSHAEANVFDGQMTYDNPFAEAFRLLRNNILLVSQDQPIKMISITSPGRAEGKSTVAVNLAVSMAMDGKQVLIVDCDMRRPSVHTKLGIDKNVGLTNLVNGLVDIKEVVVPTKVDGLYALPSGAFPVNPAEFLNSKACRDTMRSLRDLYDIVIIDSPPCAGLSDTQVISRFSDGVLLVVSLDTTRIDTLDNTIQTLALVEAPFLGFVTNKVPVKKLGYDYCGYSRQESASA